jgi:hypothetical protein
MATAGSETAPHAAGLDRSVAFSYDARERDTNMLKMTCCLLALLISLLACTEQPTSGLSPHFTGGTLFRNDRLTVTVGPQTDSVLADDPKAYLPTIEDVTFTIDDADADLPVDIEEFWGKGGWHHSAHFTAPEDARRIEVHLRVLYDGRPFEMTTVFERRINPTINPNVKWHAIRGDAKPLEN